MAVQYRTLKVVTAPTSEPVSLSEAKAQCRVDTSDDDTYIGALITAAREYCEVYCDMTFAATEYRMSLDRFPCEIEVPRPPMASTGTATAVTITYTLDSGSTATLDATEYRVDRDSVPGVLRPLWSDSWPSHRYDYNAVTVRWWAVPASTPQRLKSAILWLVAYWYERRMAADQASLNEIPFGLRTLLDSIKWRAY